MPPTSPVRTNTDVTLPVKEMLLRAMKIAEHSPEAAQYLASQARKIVESSSFLKKSADLKERAKEVVLAVEEYAKFVQFKEPVSTVGLWSGRLPERSGFVAMQKGIAQHALDHLKEKSFTGVQFDYAVSDKGHFVRGYGAVEGAPPLEGGSVESLDKLYNAWLAEKHQVTTEGGYLFRTDASGNRVEPPLSLDEVEALMADSAKGFKEYLQTNGSIVLQGRQREYPGEHRLEELKRAAEEKIAAIEEQSPDIR